MFSSKYFKKASVDPEKVWCFELCGDRSPYVEIHIFVEMLSPSQVEWAKKSKSNLYKYSEVFTFKDFNEFCNEIERVKNEHSNIYTNFYEYKSIC